MNKQHRICDLIPHAGTMCLLDEILSWDRKNIVCSSRSHLLITNPLRCADGLSAIHLVEYAAQAMAVHGGLLAARSGAPKRPGFLAAIRQAELHTQWLDSVGDELIIEAVRLLDDENNFMYSFQASSAKKLLAAGRATVIAR